MGSRSASEQTSNTNQLALDRSATLGEGQQILDSIIVDPSDQVMMETIAQHRATFETLTANSTFQLTNLLDMGMDILNLADAQQVRLEGLAYQQLEDSVEFLNAAKDQGQYVIDFAAEAQEQSYELSERAFDLVADVKTSDFSSTLKVLALFFMGTALGTVYLSGRK